MKVAAVNVAARAIRAVGEGLKYKDVDCQAFVEMCVNDCGGQMAYAGSNDMARNAVTYMATIANARAEGRLVPGAGLMIHEDDESGLPAKYRGDGLGDFSHVGLYVGEDALYDEDKNGRKRLCDVVHSSATMGRVAGSTLANGWTHVVWFREIDYGADAPEGVTLGGALAADDDDAGDGVTTGTAAPAKQMRYATVTARTGVAVRLRKEASQKCGDYWMVQVGTRVAVERTRDGWALLTALCMDGYRRRAWMMEEFLEYEVV